MERSIQDLLDIKTGLSVLSHDVFSRTEEDIFRIRRELAEKYKLKEDYLVCSICLQPVYIAGNKKHEYFFKHRHEKGDCPIKTKGKYSQEEINRMKYNGVKESEKHLYLKNFIFDKISSDQRFHCVQMEKVTKSKGQTKEWKKPDVSCLFEGKELVFEIQLSTTYLNVIVDREVFYNNEGIYIAWVFNEFDTSNQRFTEKDIYYSNKSNVLVINKETMTLSEKKKELIFKCFYKTPFLVGEEIYHKWESKNVTMNDLIFDVRTHKVFYSDVYENEKKLRENMENKYLVEFEQYWITRDEISSEERQKKDHYFCKVISDKLIIIKYFPESLERIISCLYSVKYGKVIGYSFKTLLEVAHLILEYGKEYIYIFFWAASIYGRTDEIKRADRSGNFKKKIERYKNAKINCDPDYMQETKYYILISALFPELAERLNIQSK